MTSTAVLTIDLHRGHLDPDVATLPVPADVGERVLSNVERLVSTARDAGHDVVHVTTEYRSGEEILANPNVAQTRSGPREEMPAHNLEGSPGVEIMPSIREEGDLFTSPKKGFSPFLTTDLEYVLQTRDVDRLVVAGVNTNTCVQCTSFEAYNRGYELIVVADCVDSMYGEEFHEWGLRNIESALGRTVSIDEAEELLRAASNDD